MSSIPRGWQCSFPCSKWTCSSRPPTSCTRRPGGRGFAVGCPCMISLDLYIKRVRSVTVSPPETRYPTHNTDMASCCTVSTSAMACSNRSTSFCVELSRSCSCTCSSSFGFPFGRSGRYTGMTTIVRRTPNQRNSSARDGAKPTSCHSSGNQWYSELQSAMVQLRSVEGRMVRLHIRSFFRGIGSSHPYAFTWWQLTVLVWMPFPHVLEHWRKRPDQSREEAVEKTPPFTSVHCPSTHVWGQSFLRHLFRSLLRLLLGQFDSSTATTVLVFLGGSTSLLSMVTFMHVTFLTFTPYPHVAEHCNAITELFTISQRIKPAIGDMSLIDYLIKGNMAWQYDL